MKFSGCGLPDKKLAAIFDSEFFANFRNYLFVKCYICRHSRLEFTLGIAY